MNKNRRIKTKTEHIEFPRALKEHYDMVAAIEEKVEYMEEYKITEKELTLQLRTTKTGKAAGPNKIKPEMVKALEQNETCKKTLLDVLNEVLENNNIPQNWRHSKTTLVPKNNKPTVKDFRPLAGTDITYKTLMGIMKTKIQNHLHENNKLSELQNAYCKNRRTADNIFILKYCIEKSYVTKKPLYVTSIDFSKAFDSIKRSQIINVMMKYKIHPNIIDYIANIYNNDNTTLYLNNIEQGNIQITSGIRQGCNGSTVIFLMITYIIIDKLQNCDIDFNCIVCKISAIFFADDGLLLTDSTHKTDKIIQILIDIARECGLELNKEKSKILIYNCKDKVKEIQGIETTNEIKYLGLKITNNRDCFNKQKQYNKDEATKYSNIILAIIYRSCNRLLIGKTYWKNIILPKILYGQEIINYTKTDLETLQQAENRAYRYIFQAPNHTPVTTLRGEVGASSQIARDMKTKLKYIKHLTEQESTLLHTIFEDLYNNPFCKWIKTIKEYMKTLNMTLIELKQMSTKQIENIVRRWDTEQWKISIQSKKTLQIYIRNKTNIKEETDIYDNTQGATLLFKSRTNTLPLEWRKIYTNNNTTCKICGKDEETLEHFIIECDTLKQTRKQTKIYKEYTQNNKFTIDNILFPTENIQNSIENTKRLLTKLYNKRKSILKTLETNNKTETSIQKEGGGEGEKEL